MRLSIFSYFSQFHYVRCWSVGIKPKTTNWIESAHKKILAFAEHFHKRSAKFQFFMGELACFCAFQIWLLFFFFCTTRTGVIMKKWGKFLTNIHFRLLRKVVMVIRAFSNSRENYFDIHWNEWIAKSQFSKLSAIISVTVLYADVLNSRMSFFRTYFLSELGATKFHSF